MNIALMDDDLINAPGDHLLDGLEPNLADKNLALHGIGTRHKIDLRIKYGNGGPAYAIKDLRPLQGNIPARRIKERSRGFPRLFVEVDIVNIQAGAPGMNSNPFYAAGVIRQARKAAI